MTQRAAAKRKDQRMIRPESLADAWRLYDYRNKLAQRDYDSRMTALYQRPFTWLGNKKVPR